jgi:hypothetical protein
LLPSEIVLHAGDCPPSLCALALPRLELFLEEVGPWPPELLAWQDHPACGHHRLIGRTINRRHPGRKLQVSALLASSALILAQAGLSFSVLRNQLAEHLAGDGGPADVIEDDLDSTFGE